MATSAEEIGQAKAWSGTAGSYGSNVGMISSLAAEHLIDMAERIKPITAQSKALDNGAGTGAVTVALATKHPELDITATDISGKMIESIAARNLPHVRAQVLDAHSLGQALPKDFSHVFSAFMIMFSKTPQVVLEGMKTVLAPGGTIGMGIWGLRNDAFIAWEKAAKTLDPTYEPPSWFDDPNAWRTQGELEAALREAGFKDVGTHEMLVRVPVKNPEECNEIWFRGKNPAALRMIEAFKGDLKEAEQAVTKVYRDEFDGAKNLYCNVILGVGRK